MLMLILPMVMLGLGRLVERGSRVRLKLFLSLSLKRGWRVARRRELKTLVRIHLLARVGRRYVVSVCLIVVSVLWSLLM